MISVTGRHCPKCDGYFISTSHDQYCGGLDCVNELLVETMEQSAYILDARFEVDRLRSQIIENLTGINDFWLREELLQTVEAIDDKLKRALM